jgi:hypothetical protein
MVKTARAILLTVALFVFFTGCNLGTGIFPNSLMAYEAFTDLSGYVDPDRVWNYNFQIIRDSTAGTEYLVLVNDDRSFDGVHVAIFNTDLKVLGRYTLAQLDAMGASLFNGRGAMVDANGDIVVGNRVFAIGPRRLTGTENPATLGAPGLAIPGEPIPNIADIHGSGNELRYNKYSVDWLYQPPDEHPMIGGGTNYKILCAGLDGTDVVLVAHPDGAVGVILRIPKALFAAGGLCDGLDGCYLDGFVPGSNYVLWETLGMYHDPDTGGIAFAAFAYDYDLNKREFIRFDSFGGLIGSPLSVEESPWEQLHVYGMNSGWYLFNRKELTLERRPWWWLP